MKIMKKMIITESQLKKIVRRNINEIEKYIPSIDSPEDEEEISQKQGFDKPYDVYKEKNPFKSIESDDFYDEKIDDLKRKEYPKRMKIDTSRNYFGPKPDEEKRYKRGPMKEYEIDLKIEYRETRDTNLWRQETNARIKKHKFINDEYWNNYYSTIHAEIKRKFIENRNALNKLYDMKKAYNTED